MIFSVILLDSFLPFYNKKTYARNFQRLAGEVYSSRPRIQDIEAKELIKFDSKWPNLKKANLAFVSFLLEFYPDCDLYFLARDAEMLFDTAQIIANSEELKRIHIINVSRKTMQDPNLKNYLTQNKISKRRLHRGLKIIFIDSGFAANIPKKINELFGNNYRNQLRTHLIISKVINHPSSRLFVNNLISNQNEIRVQSLDGDIRVFEDRSNLHFTYPSIRYELIGNVWEPISEFKNKDAQRKTVIEHMADLKSYLSSNEAKILSAKYRMATREVINILQSNMTIEEMISSLQDFVSNAKLLTKHERKTIIRDVFDASINLDKSFKIEVTNVLNPETSIDLESSNWELLERLPEWRPYLQHPELHIPKLFEREDYNTIEALLNSKINLEIQNIILNQLFDGPATGDKKRLQYKVMGLQQEARFVLENFASLPSSNWMKEFVGPMIINGPSEIKPLVVVYLLSQYFAFELKDEISLLIESGDKNLHKLLLVQVFSQPHHADKVDLLNSILNMNDKETLKVFLEKTTLSKDIQKNTELMESAIQKGIKKKLWAAVATALSRTKEPELLRDLTIKVLESGDIFALKVFATHGFSNYKFLQVPNVLRVFLENAHSYHIDKFLLSFPKTKLKKMGQEFAIYAEATNIKNIEKRIDFLNEKLPKKKSTKCDKILSS